MALPKKNNKILQTSLKEREQILVQTFEDNTEGAFKVMKSI